MIHIYMCGEMQWSSLGRNRAAVVGYNSEGNFFQNHPSSGSATVADIISCGINQENRRMGELRVMPVNLPVDQIVREGAEQCISKYNMDANLLRIDPTELAKLVRDYPCPLTLTQIVNDPARFTLQTQSPRCYVSTISVESKKPPLPFSIYATQQCCYDIQNG